LKPIVPHLDTMKELADRTGGRAFYNTNDIKNAVRQADRRFKSHVTRSVIIRRTPLKTASSVRSK